MTPHTPEQRKIINLYSSFALCLILSCVPNMTAQNFALLFSFIFVIWAHIERRSAAADTPLKSHATYLIRTFWIWSSILFAGLVTAGIYISLNGDMSVIDTMMQNAENGIIPTEEETSALIHTYLESNFDMIVTTAIVCIAPAHIYAAYKLYKGFVFAHKNTSIIP